MYYVPETVHPPYVGCFYLSSWSERELGAFMQMTTRSYRQLTRRLCALEEEPREIVLVLESTPDWFTGEKELSAETCESLLEHGAATAPGPSLLGARPAPPAEAGR